MCIPRTTLTRHHSLISSFVSCPVCFTCSFAPCYEVHLTAEPFEEFRYSGLLVGTSSHGAAANCLVSVVPLSFDRASGAVSVISFGTARLKVVDWKVLSNIQEFIINTIPTHLLALHVAVALSCLQFVLVLRNW